MTPSKTQRVSGRPMTYSILLVEDEVTLRELVKGALEEFGCEVMGQGNGKRALDQLGKHSFDLLITDIRLPGISGMELLSRSLEQHPGTDVILVTAYASVEQAVSALKKGAYQYLRKPFEMDELLHHVEQLQERKRMRGELEALREELSQKPDDTGLLGHSEAMHRVRELIHAVADSESNVLLTGLSGTGKSLAARAIHKLSPRKTGPFVTVNCAAIPESLLESQLFGHEPGSFTGATKRHTGYFEQAAQGTLFLDEIGDLSQSAQATILQAIQEHSFHRVGGTSPIDVDFRLISATNQPLDERVKKSEFRLDLYYRLNVVEISIPPLRERPEDIPVLANRFLRRHAARQGKSISGVSPEAWSMILSHGFDGNARELENLMERAVLLCHGREILPAHLPPTVDGAGISITDARHTRERPPLKELMQSFEASYIRRILTEHGGNRTRTALALGISRKHLWTKIHQLGIDAGDDDEELEEGES